LSGLSVGEVTGIKGEGQVFWYGYYVSGLKRDCANYKTQLQAPLLRGLDRHEKEGRKNSDIHAERASQEAWGRRFLEDKDWEPEAAVGIGYIKISAWLGTSRTNVPIVVYSTVASYA
jgi:hypothetical protein